MSENLAAVSILFCFGHAESDDVATERWTRRSRLSCGAVYGLCPYGHSPYSESLFRTLKYRPAYPSQSFESLSIARQWVVHWYNHEHRHSAIGFVTPGQRHAGLDAALLRNRTTVYEAAKRRCPQRWSGATRNWQPIQVVHLNPDQHDTKTNSQKEVNQDDKKAD